MEPGTNSRIRGRIGRAKWRRKCTQSSTNFEASQRFPGLSHILKATAKERWQCSMSMIQFASETELRCITFSQRNARHFSDTINLIGQNENLIFLNFILRGVRTGVSRGSLWTRSVVGVRGPAVSVSRLPKGTQKH